MAFIGYLIGYRASNIQRVQNPVRKEVIKVRDIKFNKKKLFDPKDIYIADHLRITYNNLQHQTISAPYFTLEFVADDSEVEEMADKSDKETIEDRAVTSEETAPKDLIS